MKPASILPSLAFFTAMILADARALIRQLELPTADEIKATKDLPIPPTNTHPVEWANAGSLGAMGVIAQRSMVDLQYRVLLVGAGSPTQGSLLPGDLIVGINGDHFQPQSYAGEHPSVKKYNRFMEPNVAMGNALDTACGKNKGQLTLTVNRRGKLGTVTIQLPSQKGFSETYPWDCEKSDQLAAEIAARFATEKLPYRNDLYATVWYGLFLLNQDPEIYEKKIEEIVALVLNELKRVRSGGPARGYGGGTWVWRTALYGSFLAEYSMIAGRKKEMLPHLNLVVDQLFDVRMVGDLWGHSKWHNYGRIDGGFVAASSQAALALLSLKQAGAALSDSALGKVMDALGSSINRQSGQVGYGSPNDGSSREKLNWTAIQADKTQLGVESLMRQGAVQLAMQLDGRTDEARACSHFMERMILSHATHGITPDWGFLDATRALESTDPAACRRLLDAIRYRLNLCLRWDGGIQLVPYRNRRGEEYGVDTFNADKYAPAMWGLILSMPKKRLFLLSKAVDPGTEVQLPTSTTHPLRESISARHLTVGEEKIYYAAPDGVNKWGVYEHDFSTGTSRLLQGALTRQPHELFYWDGKLFFSVTDSSLWVWDGKRAEKLLTNKRGRGKAPAQFTVYKGALYFVAPPGRKPAMGGELWKSDGTRQGTVKVKDGLWMLLGGSSSWQSDVGHARSMQVAFGKLFFATCETDSRGKPLSREFSLWTSDGSEKGTVKLMDAPLAVVATDHQNAPYGSYLGVEYQEKLFFSAGGRLWESDGTPAGTLQSPLNIKTPNNFSISGDRIIISGSGPRKPKGKGRVSLFISKGTAAQTVSVSPGVERVRQITSIPGTDRFFFVADDGRHGEELWASDGTMKHTKMVMDLNPGPYGGMIDNLIAIGGRIYFSASDGVAGCELWRSGGSSDSTEISDLLPGSEGSFPGQVRAADGKISFYTTAISRGRQLWHFDPDRIPSVFMRPSE